MCGRFTMHLSDLATLRVPLGVERISVQDWRPRYNVAPSQDAPVVRDADVREVVGMRWGLVPAWAEQASDGYKRINARIESVAQRPSYREPFARRRCVVPTTGFFEWRALPGKRTKQPYWVHPSDGGLMLLAGLWDRWVAPDGSALESFAIVTRDAVGPLRTVHDRMPVELPLEVLDEWLAPERQVSRQLRATLAGSVGVAHLDLTPVSSRVGSPDHDDADCIAPTTEDRRGEQLGLFGDGTL